MHRVFYLLHQNNHISKFLTSTIELQLQLNIFAHYYAIHVYQCVTACVLHDCTSIIDVYRYFMRNIYFFICKVSSSSLPGLWPRSGYSGAPVVPGRTHPDNESSGKLSPSLLTENW